MASTRPATDTMEESNTRKTMTSAVSAFAAWPNPREQHESHMPKFLEAKLKAEYGKNSKIPYKVMNSIGAMKGSKETAKGVAMERKAEAHNYDHRRPKRPVVSRYS